MRLRNDPALDAQVGTSVGADIDTVGAISTVAVVPEPATWALMLGGAMLLAARCRNATATAPVHPAASALELGV